MKRLFVTLIVVMTLIPIDARMFNTSYYLYPHVLMNNIAGPPSYTGTTFVIDAASEKAGTVLQAPKTGDITHVWWRTGTVTTGATVNVRIETVSLTDGTPTGTPCGTGGTQVVDATDDNVDFFTPLGSNCSATRGDVLAVIIENPAASFGNMQIVANNDENNYFPYGLIYTASYAKSLFSPMVQLRYSDGTYGYIPGVYAFDTVTSRTFSTSSTPDIWGNRFKFKTKRRVYGAFLHGDFDGDFTVKLVSSTYAGSGSLAEFFYDKDVEAAATGLSSMIIFNNSYDLEADQYYRLIIEPTTTTNTTMYSLQYSSGPISDAAPDANEYHLTSAKDPTGDGSWTNYNNVSDGYWVATMGLIIEGQWIPEFSHTSAN